MSAALPWIALGLLGAALVAAFGAILARSLFAMCMHLMAAGASVAAMALVLGAGEGALALALFGAAWAPVLLLAAMLLSARAAKDTRRGWPWLSLIAATAALCAVWWPLLQLETRTDVGGAYVSIGMGFWLAPLLLVMAVACVGLLGYGERGALGRDGAAQ